MHQRQKCSGLPDDSFEAYISVEDEPAGLDAKWRAQVAEVRKTFLAPAKPVKIEPGTREVPPKKRKAAAKTSGSAGAASPPMKSKSGYLGSLSRRRLTLSSTGSRSGREPSPGPSALSATAPTLPTQPTDDLMGRLAAFEQVASEGTSDALARGRDLLESRLAELNARARGQQASDALEPYAIRRDRLFAMATMQPMSQAVVPSVEPPVSDARIVEAILDLRDRLRRDRGQVRRR